MSDDQVIQRGRFKGKKIEMARTAGVDLVPEFLERPTDAVINDARPGRGDGSLGASASSRSLPEGQFVMLVAIPLDRMVPLPELFRHRSTLHGQAHVSRVMVHAMRLIDATGQHAYGPQLWASVFLHDLARTHDGVCHRHGADAAQRLREEPGLQQRLAEAGLVAADYPAIEAAVTAHSAPKEVSRDNPHWPLIALLKDADGLDRVRLGDLDPRYLRNAAAQEMVPFAQALFDATDGVIATGPAHFEQLLSAAQRL